MPEQAELQRKAGQRGLLIASYKRLKKKNSDRAITPTAEAVQVPATWCHQGTHKPSSCITFMLNSHWDKKISCVCAFRVASVMSNSLRPCRLWPARLMCQGWGGLQARILKHVGQYWLAYPSGALYFLLP